ncbi:MAG: phosphoribosylanthranilate isomerase [Candidatus Faecousia sp.]|uniref:phosphoribosylanthranilate isomerase n=1 Tax=Faecousia sp. TaxID=2952921 RepID=UPI002A87E83E|nr:phosphoribosylanthranilate isomerase [Candidatus Faecousia sp.]
MIQIYSIQTVEEALQCVQAGAEAIGVAVATGANLPAEVPEATCAEIFAALEGRAQRVLLVVTQTEEETVEYVRRLQPDILQLCGNRLPATPEFAAQCRAVRPGLRVLQAVGVDGPEAIDRAKYFAGFCDILILDSIAPGIAGIGAAGRTHDWSIDAEIVRSVPCHVVLAGGLDAENVRAAIEAVRPWGVDSFTRTSDRLPDGGSRKNIEKVRAFVQAAREAFA